METTDSETETQTVSIVSETDTEIVEAASAETASEVTSAASSVTTTTTTTEATTVTTVTTTAETTSVTTVTTTVTETETTQTEAEVKELKISIGGTEYTAHFYDTKAAEEFKAMLPLTLNMSELNGNEKYIYMDGDLTTASEKVGSIKKGELMLYGSSCVVLFYDSFSTPYSYTRLGYIDDPSGLEKAVGSGSVTVEFYTE
ncbi:MAG: hypothetical protein J1F11_07250 [Oscillospiraceae bacterium]|nr:hypothetical protein [Oscillospiraceae bacterium]